MKPEQLIAFAFQELAGKGVAPVSLRSGKNRAPAGFRRFAVAERGTPASQPQPAAAMAC
jgi:hypothetical protein